MSPPTLISDIFDLIVDHLHDQPKTLRACCLVSKEWVTRARRHLFACVIFYLDRQIKSWMAAYPDISNSPACYVRTLFVFDNVSIIAACESPPTWLHQFCRVKSFGMGDLELIADPILVSFVQLHGFSPTLHIFFLSAPLSEIVNLICSFPFSRFLFCKALPPRGTPMNVVPHRPHRDSLGPLTCSTLPPPSYVDYWDSQMVSISPRSWLRAPLNLPNR